MTRQSKKGERRAQSPRKHRNPSAKTGPKQDNLPKGFREHTNAIPGDLAATCYVAPVRSI